MLLIRVFSPNLDYLDDEIAKAEKLCTTSPRYSSSRLGNFFGEIFQKLFGQITIQKYLKILQQPPETLEYSTLGGYHLLQLGKMLEKYQQILHRDELCGGSGNKGSPHLAQTFSRLGNFSVKYFRNFPETTPITDVKTFDRIFQIKAPEGLCKSEKNTSSTIFQCFVKLRFFSDSWLTQSSNISGSFYISVSNISMELPPAL